MDFQIPNEYTLDYLRYNDIKADINIINDMGHVFDLDEFIKIVKTSKLIKKN